MKSYISNHAIRRFNERFFDGRQDADSKPGREKLETMALKILIDTYPKHMNVDTGRFMCMDYDLIFVKKDGLIVTITKLDDIDRRRKGFLQDD